MYRNTLSRYIEADMGKLIEFYNGHRRLFLSQKHQNTRQTERFRGMVILKFLEYCEFQKIFHTAGITKRTALDFFLSQDMSNKSDETKRKYFLVLREFYSRNKKIELQKEDCGL